MKDAHNFTVFEPRIQALAEPLPCLVPRLVFGWWLEGLLDLFPSSFGLIGFGIRSDAQL